MDILVGVWVTLSEVTRVVLKLIVKRKGKGVVERLLALPFQIVFEIFYVNPGFEELLLRQHRPHDRLHSLVEQGLILVHVHDIDLIILALLQIGD